MTANKHSINWLSNYPCKGIDFRLGDNGVQLFYEAKVRGITWMVLRPKTSCHWVVIAERKGSLKTLNTRVKHFDGAVEEDPLFHIDCTEDIPVTLLSSLVEYINSSADPFCRNDE